MSTWVLLIFLIPGRTDLNAQIQTIPFATEKACVAAEDKISTSDFGKMALGGGGWYSLKVFCLETGK